jgi:alkanesulfonate monooxygenase SsuD/methylene tetrahydromethanopterin reductase-like flavin-dependent oxidoreductase (luciferase family)
LDAKDIVDLANDLQVQASALSKPHAPSILVLCDLFIRDEPGRAREEYEALVNSSDPEAQKVWKSHLARVTHKGRNPGEVMGFLGTADEVAEQIIALRRETGIAGLMFRLPLWLPEEAHRLTRVFAQLERAGVWKPPAERDFSW